MSATTSNPYRSPACDVRPTCSSGTFGQRVFGAVALTLGVCLAISGIGGVLGSLATGLRGDVRSPVLITLVLTSATAYWLIRLGLRDLRAGK